MKRLSLSNAKTKSNIRRCIMAGKVVIYGKAG